MSKYLLLTCFVGMLAGMGSIMAQEKCGSMTLMANTFQRNPALKSRFDLQTTQIRAAALQRKAQFQLLRTEGTTAYIPVVFHIVLRNPNLVTDAQIQAQIDQLNRDYGGLNPDSTRIPPAFKPLFAKTNIQFKLAQRTPNNDPSNGIERVTTTQASYSINDNRVKYTALGGADAWDNSRFFNVWITDLSQGYLGYSTFPASGPDAEDGCVIKYTSLPGGTAPYNVGRTLVHEAGHFFYLYHIWGDEDYCAGTDFIDDTPNQGTYTSGCPGVTVKTDTCTKTAPGIMYENYMDYTDDACMVMFTLDQKIRMETSLSMYRASLLTSNGANPVVAFNLDAAAKSINIPLQRICSATFSPVITLRNKGAQTLTAVTIKATLDNGTVTSTTHWTGALLSLTETTVTLNALTVATEGAHLLNIDISSPNGSTDENTSNDDLTLAFQYYQPITPPFSESFENPVFPPERWDIVNPDQSVTWERTLLAAKTGKAAVVMHNFDYQANGQKDYIRLPLMNIPTADSAFMTFQVAAAAVSDTGTAGNAFDSLEVLVSQDCGATFTSLYKKGGKELLTRLTPVTDAYKPTSTEWRKDSVNLTPYINAGQILVAFANTNEHENNVYLDDINVYTLTVNPVLKTKGFMITPNPTTSKITIQFYPYPAFVKGINIFTSTGQRVASQRLNAAGSSGYTFDLTGMASGVYMVQVVLGDKVITQKVIKR